MSEIGRVSIKPAFEKQALNTVKPDTVLRPENVKLSSSVYLNKNDITPVQNDSKVPATPINLSGSPDEGGSFAENYHLTVNIIKATNSTARDAVRTLKVNELFAEKLVGVYEFIEWARLKNLTAEELSVDYKAQMKLQALAENTNDKLMKEISELLGVEMKGKPKDIARIIDKLKKGSTQLTDLKDITRARIDLPKLDKEKIEAMTKTIMTNYKIDPETGVKDFMKEISNPASEYKGRVHFRIPVENGLVFELQVGPKQLTSFYSTKFKIRGVEQNLHNAIYKGINLYLTTPDKGEDYLRAMKGIGNGSLEQGEKVAAETLKTVGNGDITKGRQVLENIKTKYLDNLNHVLKLAESGKNFEYEKLNKSLINDLDKVYKNIPHEDLPPVFKEKLAMRPTKTISQLSALYGEIHKLPIDQGGKNVLRELAKKNISENTLRNIFKTVEAASKDPEEYAGLLRALQKMPPDMLEKVLLSDDATKGLMKISSRVTPFLRNYGEEGAKLASKVSSSIGKALPVIGGTISAADTYRLGTIASTGTDPFTKKEYKDADVRRLAGIGAGINGFDAAITGAEVFGFRAIDLPVQLALTGVEIAIDVLVEKFNEHPERMTDKTREIIRTLSFSD